MSQDEQLDFSSVFSSPAPPSRRRQVDYVGANAFLDAFAEKARGEGRTCSRWPGRLARGLAASSAESWAATRHARQGTPARIRYSRQVLSQGRALLRAHRDGALWMLYEHRNGEPSGIWPGTGYLSWRAPLCGVGHDGPFAIEDLYFLRPLDVPDEGGLEFRVKLKGSSDGFNFELQSKSRCLTARRLRAARTGVLAPLLPVAPPPIDLAEIDARCQIDVSRADRGHRVKQEKHLLFGPRWRTLRRFAFGEAEAVAELTLREQFTPDLTVFGLHPALLDIATGFAIELEPSYGAGDRLWVPVSYDKVSVYGDLTPTLHSFVQLRTRSGRCHRRFARSLRSPRHGRVWSTSRLRMQAMRAARRDQEPRAQELEQEGPS